MNPSGNDSLKACIETSLNQVNHQIWLLKNGFWWYRLPFAAALGISIFFSTWRAYGSGSSAVLGGMIFSLFVALLYWGIYWMNQFAVRKDLDPRRQELETLLASLQ